MMYLNFVGAEDTGIIEAVKCQVLHSSGTRTGNVNLPKFVSRENNYLFLIFPKFIENSLMKKEIL